VNYRVIDSGGRFIGAAGVGISVDTLRGMVARFRSEFATSIYFVKSDGAIVAGAPFGLDKAYPSVSADPALAAAAARALYLNLGLCAFVLCLVLLASILTVNRFQSRLERSASRDPLTGALNRLAFNAIAEHALKASRRSGEALAAIMFDIDGFKKVNDELGHPAGDAVLVDAALRARSAIRDSDLLCRWGGDEFLVLLRDCHAPDALAIAEKLRKAIEEGCSAGPPGRVTVSAGVAEEGADEALLKAKRAGRNRAFPA